MLDLTQLYPDIHIGDKLLYMLANTSVEKGVDLKVVFRTLRMSDYIPHAYVKRWLIVNRI